MPLKSRTRSRRVSLLLALLLLVLPLGLSVSGCNPFAQPPAVADNPEQAFKDGEAKESDAEQAAKTNDKTEATERWNKAATYYAAVANKFAGSENGLRALLEEANAYEKAENPNQAHAVLKGALKQYTPGANQTPGLQAEYAKTVTAERELVRKLDEQNSQTFYYKVMDALVRVFGGDDKVAPVLAVIAVAFLVTVVVWPLRVRQYRSAKEMQRYQPELEKLRNRHKGDPQVAMQKQQEFFKEHGINQFAGCLPMLLQMPVTIFMYQVILHYQFHFANSTFLWINPASGDWAAKLPWPLTGALAHNLGEQDLLMLVIYAISMFVQSKLMPVNSTDPQVIEQQKMMAVTMPAFFFVMMLQWQPASAFVLYWFVSNILSLIQQAIIYRTLPPMPPLVLSDSGSLVPEGDGTGGGAAALTANPKLVSPKNKRKK